MRVALLTTRSGPQAARFAALCGALAARGHEVLAVCPPGAGALLAPGVRHAPWLAPGAWWNPLARAQLAFVLAGFRPGVVHAHGDKAAALLASVARRTGRRPMVASLPDRRAARPFAPDFDHVILASPPALARFRAKHPGVAAEALFPAAPPAPPAAPGAGRALRERLCVPWGAPAALVRLTGADPGGEDPRGPASGGVAELLNLWEWVGEAELWVVSDGGPRARLLEAQCRDLGRLIEGGYDRGGMVNGIRFLRREDGAAALDACDLAVSPARTPGQSVALAEALLAGKPVVAAGNAWAQGVLPPEYAVAADDADGLRSALGAAVSDVARLREAQAAAFVHARENWTVGAVAARVEAAYAAAGA